MKKEFSRRNFLQGAGAMLALGGLGQLTGCNSAPASSAPAEKPTETANTQAAVKAPEQNQFPEWMGEPTIVKDSDISETIETEVLVVGCGTAGWGAAATAAENGAKVTVVERADKTTKPKEDLGAIDSSLQQAYYKEHPEFYIDKMKAMHEIGAYAGNFVDFDLIKLWADESGEMIDWIANTVLNKDEFEMQYEAGLGNTEYESIHRAWPTGHSPQPLNDDKENTWQKQWDNYGEKLGINFLFKTSLVSLVQDDNKRVIGIIARDNENKSYKKILASKGTVITTGGYSANTKMMQRFQPEILQLKVDSSNGSMCSGEGIIEAMRIGAQKDPIGTSLLFNRCCVKPDEVSGYETQGKWFWFGEQPFLKVNLEGKRFVNESGPYDYILHAAYMQPQHMYVDIWDSDYPNQAKTMEEVGCCRLYPFDNGALNNIPMKAVEGMNQKLVDEGYIQVADTIEELAQKLNIPADTLKETYDNYNKYAQEGKDPEFGKEPHRLLPLNKPPYYGVRTAAWHLCTFDGLRINTDMQVLDEDNKPIEGLYAAGDAAGGFFSVNYPNLFTGLAAGKSMTFGRHVGKLLASK